ncbi:glycine zipper 2TM domain-containing protein [Alkalilacustris brevis]|uniref:glycine zipper 2TM domain-containing protein n=1 Tax=Alkalilacustris brevis TaxID=2026338 RepID=UPI000E0DA472|nr:glucose-6-phosphate isomerase [Alkalilacustris brevis]
MRRPILMASCAAVLGLAACDGMTSQERMVVGGLAGATVGVVAADFLRADRNWTIIAGLAGATAGALVARNQQSNECAYARGDGTYRIAPCP